MLTRRLQARFLLAGSLLVATTLLTGLGSALTFARISAAADDALQASQARLDLTAELASALEREDDALLLALSGAGGAEALAAARRRGDDGYRRLAEATATMTARERSLVGELGRDRDRYRAAGDALRSGDSRGDVLKRYHDQVNPLLRQAVARCGEIREESFAAMRQAGVDARDVAGTATWGVFALAVASIALAIVVSAWLARSVLRPVQTLTQAVEAIRAGDFDRRVPPASTVELGRLTEGFNRMAEDLAAYRRSSLGELMAAKHTLEGTLNALPDAVLVVAPDGTLAALNPLARRILDSLGCARASSLEELPLRPGHRAAVEAALAGRPSGPGVDFAQALTVALDGRPHCFLLAAAPIPELLPQRCGAAIVLADVTELARLDDLRGELIGVASHELKTPLTTLRMTLLLLKEDAAALSERQREMLSAALRGCEELGGTIDELLDVTRIEAGQLRLDLAPVDVEPIVRQVLRVLQPRCDDAGVRVLVERACEHSRVRGDAARLGTVLSNLLTNALKYSPPGGTVTVRLSSGQNAGRDGAVGLQITVTDQGRGIPAELRERVFEKFFRVEHHTDGSDNGVRGTGIGLYLCREILRAHGGTICCEPGEGGLGTRIAFTLPLQPSGREG
jgi:NtrC-family two-component system sensor histidine kinase KinB